MSRYGIITFVCRVTSRRVGCGCTVRSFTTLGECGLSLSLGLRLDENTRSGYHIDLELSDRSREWLEIWIPLWELHWVLLSRQGLDTWMSFRTWTRLTIHWIVSDCDLGKVSGYTPSKGCLGLHVLRIIYKC